MTVYQYKALLHDKLDLIYGPEEVKSFYYLILKHYLNLDRVSIALNPTMDIAETELYNLKRACRKLQSQVPLQYILGETEFYGLKFKVNKNVLIPRPETEELVDWIIKDYKDRHETISVLDIGTGSGCIAISIAKNLNKSEVYALDISPDALEMAGANAIMNNVDIDFKICDILGDEHNLKNTEHHFNIIVSNPPYVRASEKIYMKDNVLKNEPSVALFVDDLDPLIFYSTIAKIGKSMLKAGGSLYFEINQYLSAEMIAMLNDQGYKKIELRKDIFGIDRMIKARKT